jgi:hypothetical protein
MARWWSSMWLANVLPHGHRARAQRAAGATGPGGNGAEVHRVRPGVLAAIALGALAVAAIAFFLMWRHVAGKP